MKTKFNCLLVIFIISTFQFSCKTRKVEIIEQMKEKEEAAKAAENSVFRPKRIYISTDSTTYRLVFENEYDELGRLKSENYYLDTNTTDDGAVNTLYRKELSYSDKLISTKSFTRIRYSNLYKQSGWDSSFYDNINRKIKQKSLASYQSSLEWYNDSIVGAKSYFDFTYSTIGDTSIENGREIRYNQPSNTTRYIDKNNVVVRYIDSAGCSAMDYYKLERTGSFVSRYVVNYSINENTKLFSVYERNVTCQSYEQKVVTNLNWSFDSQGRPTRLILVENANGVITKSYYRYEY